MVAFDQFPADLGNATAGNADDGVVKVLDLGLARLAVCDLEVAAEGDPASLDNGDRRTTSGSVTDTDQVLGTGDYMAPEQWRDSRQVDARADIYALGCTLYFLLAGRAPFAGTTKDTFATKMVAHAREPVPDIRLFRSGVPERVVAILHRMLAKDPQDRYQTATAVAEALEAAVASEKPAAAQGPPREEWGTGWQSRTRRAKPLWLLGILLLVALGAGLFLFPYVGRLLYLARNLPDQNEIDGAIAGLQTETNQFAGGVLKDLSADLRDRERELEENRREVASANDVLKKSQSPSKITNSIGMHLRLIPAGEFQMGSLDSDPEADPDEKPRHRVEISKPFYLGQHEVTVGQFKRFVDATDYRTQAEVNNMGGWLASRASSKGTHSRDTTWRNPGFAQTDEHPVCLVTWDDSIAFCKWLSEHEHAE